MVSVSVGLGLIMGVILALTGAGGRIQAVPLLIFGVGLSVAQEGPIGLLAVELAAALGAGLGLKAGTVRYKAALLVTGTGVLLSPFGVWLANRMDNRWLSPLFAIVLLFVAYRTFRQVQDQPTGDGQQGRRSPPCVRDNGNGRFIWTTRCTRALALTGTVADLLGVGDGFFVMVPALQHYTDLAMQSIVATSLAVIALVSMRSIAPSALAGTLAGIMGSRLIASRLAGPHLQKGFAAVSALVAIGMIGKSFL